MSTLGAAIRNKRREQRYTQTGLAIELDIGASCLNRYEAGRIPCGKNYEVIRDWLGLTPQQMHDLCAATSTGRTYVVDQVARDRVAEVEDEVDRIWDYLDRLRKKK